jgi:hypothetical protein
VRQGALYGNGQLDIPEEDLRINVVLARFVDDAKMMRWTGLRSAEAEIDLTDLERCRVATAADADDVALAPTDRGTAASARGRSA